MNRRTFCQGTILATVALPLPTVAAPIRATLYKIPQCTYVVDGHVPVNVIRKLLSERPAIAGITLPGMADGSPGMPGRKSGPFTIYAVTKDGAPPKVYATE